ncbi:MAG: hypothetical protein LCH39_05005 [Proteobacteria bacterium]|nr:hypothetical protein [Pseudomonadota bacterium]
MPTILPTSQVLPAPNRRLLIGGVLLAGLLSVPIIAMLSLEGLLAARCATSTVSEGVVQGKVLWKIERRDCSGAKAPFFDVMIGADGKTFSPALTGRGEPRPLAVVSAGENRAEVRLSAPIRINGQETSTLVVRLRRSGSPAERIDLEKLTAQASGGGAP